jgi:hypothetical protein
VLVRFYLPHGFVPLNKKVPFNTTFIAVYNLQTDAYVCVCVCVCICVCVCVYIYIYGYMFRPLLEDKGTMSLGNAGNRSPWDTASFSGKPESCGSFSLCKPQLNRCKFTFMITSLAQYTTPAVDATLKKTETYHVVNHLNVPKL